MVLKKWRKLEGKTGRSLKENRERGRRDSKEGQNEKGREREKKEKEREEKRIGSHLFLTSAHKEIMASISITS